MTPQPLPSRSEPKDILARQSALLERAIAALDEKRTPATEAEAVATADRAMSLLSRAMDALERAPPAAAGGADPRSAELLGRAITVAEARDEEARRLETLLARALDMIARLDAQVAERDREIEKRGEALNELLSLSERSLSAASQHGDLARVGFWRRLFGASAQSKDRRP